MLVLRLLAYLLWIPALFAVPGDLDGEAIMAARYQDVWAISADPMPVSLACGGRRTRSWAVRFGLAGWRCSPCRRCC